MAPKRPMPLQPDLNDLDLNLEGGTYNLPPRRPVVYLGLTKDTWVFIAFCIVVITFLIAIVILAAQEKKELEDLSLPLTDPSGINEDMLKFLIENSGNAGCSNSLTISPVAVCDMLCDKEFCAGKFASPEPCNGNYCRSLSTPVTLDQCKVGCLCCGVYHDCLLKNNNNEQYCKGIASPECSFSNPGIPIDPPANVCLAPLSQNYCFQVGVGFNPAVTCTSA